MCRTTDDHSYSDSSESQISCATKIPQAHEDAAGISGSGEGNGIVSCFEKKCASNEQKSHISKWEIFKLLSRRAARLNESSSSEGGQPLVFSNL